MAKLLVHESGGETREVELVDPEVHIGRELDNTLRLPDPSISRHHCVVRRTASGFEVQDLQSSNGVLVNGTRVQSSPLRNGDRITLGQIQLSFQNLEDEGATVAIKAGSVPESPVGTVRMSPEEMAAIHGEVAAGRGTDPVKMPSAQGSPMSTSPMVATPPSAPAPAAAPPVAAVPPVAPPPAIPPIAPPPMAAAMDAPVAENPAPAFLQAWLPPVPDPARPTGERGDFLTRLLAYLIDAVGAVVLFIPLMILSMIPFVGCLMIPINMLFGFGYLAFMLWCCVKFRGTIGKKAMKLRVVPEDNIDGHIDWNIAILRAVGYFVNGILFGLPYLMILGSERKGLQDIISKSIVIKVDR
ncbi:MAG TPA: FHA domain-containing protein [Holophagaceae bacterium]|nr:FHA domain-containing protein [Holophagaceae bacterium]